MSNIIECETVVIFTEVIFLLTKQGLTFNATANKHEFRIELTGGF